MQGTGWRASGGGCIDPGGQPWVKDGDPSLIAMPLMDKSRGCISLSGNHRWTDQG